jgi:DNA end-binding protein Ku
VPDRRTKPDAKALKLATQIVDSLAGEWKPEQYHDTYAEELRARIERGEYEADPQAVAAAIVERLRSSTERRRGAARTRGCARRTGLERERRAPPRTRDAAAKISEVPPNLLPAAAS